MGDIFDLLFNKNKFLYEYSKNAIDLINKLSQYIEVYYLEGNHDFLLKEYFMNVTIFTRENQPVKCTLHNKTIYLSHGDRYETGIIYNIYSKVVRTKFITSIATLLIKKIIYKLKKQEKCYKNYKLIINKIKLIIKNYPENSLIIEGHFHQGIIIDNYISLPSLICQKKISILKDKKIIFIDFLTLIDQF